MNLTGSGGSMANDSSSAVAFYQRDYPDLAAVLPDNLRTYYFRSCIISTFDQYIGAYLCDELEGGIFVEYNNSIYET